MDRRYKILMKYWLIQFKHLWWNSLNYFDMFERHVLTLFKKSEVNMFGVVLVEYDQLCEKEIKNRNVFEETFVAFQTCQLLVTFFAVLLVKIHSCGRS